MAEAAEPIAAPAGAPEHTVDIIVAAPAAPNVELVDSDAELDEPPTPAPQASPRKLYVYTRAEMLRLASSPMVKAPTAMPSLKEWYGDFYEPSSTPLKKDSDAPSGRERTRFRHGDDGESSARPSFKPSYSQSTQMGNFKHQSLRDRERDTAERDRDGERLRSLSDKYDRDRLSGTATSPLSSRAARDRDTAPHLPAGTSQRLAGATSSSTRKVEVKEGPKRKGDVSEDWRRGTEAARGGRDDRDRLDAPRRDRERARDTSRQRDRDDGRRERDDRRGERGERDERDKDDRRRERGRERDAGDRERDRDEDPRHWRDDGRRDERLASRRDRDRDEYHRDRETARSRERRGDERDAYERDSRRNRDDRELGDAKRDRDLDEGDSKPSRRGGRERESRRTVATAEDDKVDKERKERQKEQPAWMETYVPDSAAGGILGGAEDGRMDDLQAWKKEMRGKMEKDKAATGVVTSALPTASAPPKPESGGVDELATIKLMIKRAQETPPAANSTPVQDPAIVAAIPSSAQSKSEQENGISGLRRIMGKDMKTDESVLRTAGISSSSVRRPTSSRPNDVVDTSDFESGLSSAQALTSTPVLAQQATMDGTVPKGAQGISHALENGFGTSRLEAMLRESNTAALSSAYPPAKALNDPAIVGASVNQPQQPRLFTLQAHAQSAALREQGSSQHLAPGRPPSTSLVNNQTTVHPDMNSRLNIDTASPDPMNRQGAFSPFEQAGRGPMSPPLGVSAADSRTRGPTGQVQRPSASSADGIAPLESINTSSAMLGSGQSDQPISPQSAAGFGQSKGSRFAKFFHERTTAAAAQAQAQAAAGISHLLPQQQQQQQPQPQQQQPQHQQQQLAPPVPQPTPSMHRAPVQEVFTPHSLGAAGNHAHLQDLLSMLQQGSSMQNSAPAVRHVQDRTYMRESDDLRQPIGRQQGLGPSVSSPYVHQQPQPLHLLNRADTGGYDNHVSQEQLLQQLRAGARSRERPPHLTSPAMFSDSDDFSVPFVSAPPRLAPAQQVMFDQLQGHAAVRQQQQQQQMFAPGPQQRAMGLSPVGGPGGSFRPVPSPIQHLGQQQQQQPRGMPASLATLGQRPPLDPNQFIGAGGLGMGGILPGPGNASGLLPRAGGMLSPQQQAQQQFGGFGGHSGFPQQQAQQQRNPMLGADFTVQARTQLPPGHALSPGLRGAPFGNAGQQLGQQQIALRGGQQLPQHMSHLTHGPPPPHMQLPMSPPGHQPMGSNPSDLMALLMGGNRSVTE